MTTSGRILIIDDDPDFLDVYRSRLGEEGYVVDSAESRDAALAQLAQPGWDVILLDQKLQGREGPDTGLDLLAEVTRCAPGAKTILVTAYATTGAITRAFREGVYDYLQKDDFFEVLLLAKLRNAIHAARDRDIGSLSEEQLEAAIQETWAAIEHEADPNRKGKLLEDLMVYLLRTIPGFKQVSARRENELEEIDIVVQNESDDPLWSKEGAYLLVECKSWSKPVGVDGLRSFLWKLARRFWRAKLGLFVAPAGFAGTFKQELLSERTEELARGDRQPGRRPAGPHHAWPQRPAMRR